MLQLTLVNGQRLAIADPNIVDVVLEIKDDIHPSVQILIRGQGFHIAMSFDMYHAAVREYYEELELEEQSEVIEGKPN